MYRVLVFEVICDKKDDADTLMIEFASLGMNVAVARQTAVFGAGKQVRKAEPLKQEEIFVVSVDLDVLDGDAKACEKQFVAAYKEVIKKTGLKLSGEYMMRPAFYGVACPFD